MKKYKVNLIMSDECTVVADTPKEAENIARETFGNGYFIDDVSVEEVDRVKIGGIIFNHGRDDYGLWEGFNLTEEEEDIIQSILLKHDTEGCSLRGTRNEIADEFRDETESKSNLRIIKLFAGLTEEFEIIETDAPDSVIVANISYINNCLENASFPEDPYEVIKAMGYHVTLMGSHEDYDNEVVMRIIDKEFDYYKY